MKTRLALFVSGSGTNAEKIIEYFDNDPTVEIVLLVASKPDAFAIKRVRKYDINSLVITKNTLNQGTHLLPILTSLKIDLIILAGFLWLIPKYLIKEFPNKIINIHPALLPAYGGKGMYGRNVHQAVKDNQEEESGITIHYVNEAYDEGAIIFQKSFLIQKEFSVDDIEQKVHQLEHQYFPEIIDKVIKELP